MPVSASCKEHCQNNEKTSEVEILIIRSLVDESANVLYKEIVIFIVTGNV